MPERIQERLNDADDEWKESTIPLGFFVVKGEPSRKKCPSFIAAVQHPGDFGVSLESNGEKYYIKQRMKC